MGTVRQPRAYLSVNGANIQCLELEWTTHRQKSSDTWSAKFPMSAPGVDVAYWANTDEISITINATNDASQGGLQAMLTGSTDKIDFDWAERTISASGRDLSKQLMDATSQGNFKNKSSDDIAQQIASNHGFTVQSDSSSTAGRQYTTDFDELSANQSEWQLLSMLAEREGKEFYFKGTTIYFKDPSALGSGDGTLAIEYTPPTDEEYATGNFVSLSTSRDCQVSKQTTVNVTSWHPNEKKAITSTATSGGGEGGGGSSASALGAVDNGSTASGVPIPVPRPADIDDQST